MGYIYVHCILLIPSSIPPVISKGYQAKGEYKTINGLKTCNPAHTNSN